MIKEKRSDGNNTFVKTTSQKKNSKKKSILQTNEFKKKHKTFANRI